MLQQKRVLSGTRLRPCCFMKSASECFIALDQGSSSSRAFSVDALGKIKYRAGIPVKASYPENGRAQYDASVLLKSQLDALDLLLCSIPSGSKPAAMGIASQRSTVVLWDRDSGMPLCPALSWQDGRGATELEEARLNQEDVHSRTGLYATPYYSASKLRWCMRNYPEVATAIDRGRLLAGPVSSFLIWHITRGDVFAADPSMAQRTLLFNIQTFDWDESLLKSFGVPRDILPAIRPSLGDWGEFKKGNLKIPLAASLGDQQAAACWLGAEGPETAVINYGSGAFFLLGTGDKSRDVPGLLASVGWQESGGKRCFFLEGTVNSASTVLDWLKSLGMIKDIKTADRMCRASSNRLMVLPALGGLGAPRWDYQTFTTMTGLSGQTKKEDVVRGCIEGLAYLVSDISSCLRANGLAFREVRASGGLSAINHLIQFQSDLLGTGIVRIPETEATAMGAAFCAARSAGFSVSAWRREKGYEKFEPRISAGETEKLLDGWKKFVAGCGKISRDARSLGILPHS